MSGTMWGKSFWSMKSNLKILWFFTPQLSWPTLNHECICTQYMDESCMRDLCRLETLAQCGSITLHKALLMSWRTWGDTWQYYKTLINLDPSGPGFWSYPCFSPNWAIRSFKVETFICFSVSYYLSDPPYPVCNVNKMITSIWYCTCTWIRHFVLSDLNLGPSI